MLSQITLQDIIDFEKQYKDSEEEKQDLKRLYLLHEGDMDRIMASAPCSRHEDEPRVRDILQRAIDAKDVPAYRVFIHESARKKATRKRKVSGFSFIRTSQPRPGVLSECHECHSSVLSGREGAPRG